MVRRRSRVSFLQLLLIWASQWILWLVFAASLDSHELLFGLLASGMATLGAVIFSRQIWQDFTFRWQWVMEGFRIPWYAVSGTGQVLFGLYQQSFTLRRAASVLVGVPFVVGGRNAKAAARRVLAVTYTTATPNSIVVGIARKQRLMLVHQIVPGPIKVMTRRLGARP
jgi:multisubunit Na+/H+ antiporter MnhE subunit